MAKANKMTDPVPKYRRTFTCAAVTVISGEALHMYYGDVTCEEMLPYYTARTDGLTVITSGFPSQTAAPGR